MKIEKYKSEEEWLEARKGRIGSSRLGSLFSKRDRKPLKSYYEIIAERIAIPANGESVLDRGHRLEDEAVARFQEETGKKAVKDLIIWAREDNKAICASPDAVVVGEPSALEIKCLNSASHIEAWLTKEIPKEYEEQALQYFIVNDKLKTLYFCFYDPRMPKDFFYIEIKREDVEDKIAEFLELQERALAEIEDIVCQLTF